jgi:hypothetical protein
MAPLGSVRAVSEALPERLAALGRSVEVTGRLSD